VHQPAPWLVTRAFSYTGRHVAERLLARGIPVRTLTGHPQRPHPFGSAVSAFPYSFDDPLALATAMASPVRPATNLCARPNTPSVYQTA
jgi:NADH dehydrogenase